MTERVAKAEGAAAGGVSEGASVMGTLECRNEAKQQALCDRPLSQVAGRGPKITECAAASGALQHLGDRFAELGGARRYGETIGLHDLGLFGGACQSGSDLDRAIQ